MALTLKADTKDIPAIAQWLMGGGLPDMSTGDSMNPPESGAMSQPDNYVMAPDASGNPAPLPPSPGRDAVQQQAPTRLDGLRALLAGTNGPGVVPSDAPAVTKAAIGMNYGAQQEPPVPEPQPPQVYGPNQPLPPDIAGSELQNGAPREANFQQRHPLASKIIGAALQVGEGAAAGAGAPSFGAGYEQATMLPIQRMLASADIQDKQSQTNLRKAQAQQLTDNVQVRDPYGNVVNIPKKDYERYLAAQSGAVSRENVADTQAQSREKVADIRAWSAQKIAQLKSDVQSGKKIIRNVELPDGSFGVGAFDANTLQPIGVLQGAVGPAWMQPTTRVSERLMYDENGNLQRVPVTSVTQRHFSGGTFPGGNTAEQPSAATQSQSPPSGVSVILPPQSGNQSNATTQSAPTVRSTGGQPQRNSRGASPVIDSTGNTFAGPKAADPGYAFNPNDNNWYLTNRGEAAQQGLQQFRKASSQDIGKDRQMVVRLQDIGRKTQRYEDDFQNDISASDRANMSAIIADDRLHLGISHTNIPTGWLGKLSDSEFFQAMSPEAKRRTIDYFNAREAMSGYTTVLSGSARSSDKNLELQLQSLPNPLWTPGDAKYGFQQWKENLGIVGRGLPIIPGVNDHRSAGAVLMRAPNGQTKQVPADQVEHYKSIGATVVTQ